MKAYNGEGGKELEDMGKRGKRKLIRVKGKPDGEGEELMGKG